MLEWETYYCMNVVEDFGRRDIAVLFQQLSSLRYYESVLIEGNR